MDTHDRLTDLILKHWSRYRPLMVEQLRQQNRLEEEVNNTAEALTDLMYDLAAVRRMRYHRAWEFAIQQSSSTSPSDPPETSASNRTSSAII